MNKYTIRPAKKADAAPLLELVQALCTHTGDGIEHFDDDRFLEDAFGDDPQFTVLVASDEAGQLGGYTLFFDAYEPSHTARGVYISDLFVATHARQAGLGRQLIAAVAKDAKARGRSFLWLVSPNADAHPFYNKIMDVSQALVAFALTYDAFDALAAAD
ncbi:MAG: GNAT family N-acetyltransferase [Bacteroidota bacterium]